MTTGDRDASLDALLELAGQVFVIDPGGYWVKFVVQRVEASAERPHGLAYSLTLHGPDGDRLVGFDNAHPVREDRRARTRTGVAHDHQHRLRAVRPYDYSDAATLQ